MNKGRLNGVKTVFSFTVTQNLKSSGVKFTFIFLCVAVLLSMPIMHLMSNSEDDEKAPFKTVYVKDNTGLGLGDFSNMNKEKGYEDIKFAKGSKEGNLGEDDVQLIVDKSTEGFMLKFTVAEKSDMTEEKFESYGKKFTAYFQEVRKNSIHATDAQLQMINMPVETKLVELEEGGKIPDENKALSQDAYYFFLAFTVVIIMLLAFSAETISSSVITEKSNKLVENLMISVDTNALIVGKVAGALTVVAIEIAGMVVCGVLSSALTMVIFGMDKMELPKQVDSIINGASSGMISIGSLIVILVVFLLGVIFYGLLAALFGAAVSKMEDMAEGMKTFNFIMVLSAYAGIALSMGHMAGADVSSLGIAACILPITSMFAIPLELLAGNIGIGFAALCIVILIGFIVLLSMFVTKVYRVMILYKGEVLKLRNIIGMAKKGGESHE